MSAGTVLLTALALIAFASNSLLTRLALGARAIDAATFTAVRLGSGAIVLSALVALTGSARDVLRPRSATGPIILIVYAIPFSFAYLRIGAGVGALVLFGAVQLTMIGYGVALGERMSARGWAGIVLASAGLVLLTLRSPARPDPAGVLLMACAGVAWGAYSIVGRTAADPVRDNAHSFIWSAPLAVVLALAAGNGTASASGILLAAVAGAVTSAIGYAIWFRALRGLAVVQAAVAQLSVPVIAAVGGVLLLGETVSARLVVAGAAVLGGVALTLRGHDPAASRERR